MFRARQGAPPPPRIHAPRPASPTQPPHVTHAMHSTHVRDAPENRMSMCGNRANPPSRTRRTDAIGAGVVSRTAPGSGFCATVAVHTVATTAATRRRIGRTRQSPRRPSAHRAASIATLNGSVDRHRRYECVPGRAGVCGSHTGLHAGRNVDGTTCRGICVGFPTHQKESPGVSRPIST